MYKIGEFSKITNLTIKALHYYDDENILKPAEKLDNNYRLYNEEDLKKAKLISLLRRIHFSIAEVKDVLLNYEEAEDLEFFLKEKKDIINEKIKSEKKLIKEIDNLISPKLLKGEINMSYEVKEKEIEKVIVISVRFKGTYSDIGKYIGALYKEAKSNVCGNVLNLYYDAGFEENADIELCLPISKKISSSKFEVKLLPSIKAITTIHKGSYETINEGYRAVIDYAKSNNIELDVPSRLIYHKGPGMIFKGNPDNYITEIVIPVKEVN